ncbi:MAG: TolC family protein [Vulcanimicrobiota bacterium]
MSGRVGWKLLLLVFWLASPAGADPLWPDEAVRLALQIDPRLQRERALVEGARAYSQGAGALPNPVLQLSAVDGSSPEDSNSLTQTLEIAGQPYLRGQAAARDHQIALAGFEKTRREVIREAARAYYDYWEALAVARLYAGQLDFATRLQDIAEKRLAAGEISSQEKLRVEQNRAEVEVAVVSINGQLAVARRRLEAMLADQSFRLPSTEEPVPDAPAFAGLTSDQFQELELGLVTRPELVAAQRAAERDDFAARLAGRAGAPDLQVSAYRSSLGNLANQGIQFSLVVPLFDWGRTGAEAARRRKVAEARVYEVFAVRRQVGLELYSAFNAYQIARQKRDLTRQLAGNYLHFMQVTHQGYAIGLLSFVEVFDAQSANLRGFESYLRAEAEFRRAQVELWWASGLDYGPSRADEAAAL